MRRAERSPDVLKFLGYALGLRQDNSSVKRYPNYLTSYLVVFMGETPVN
jgi:hypothetical protein